mgnify:CR=1 FL=1
MILENEIFKIGETSKTHGINGEISFSLLADNWEDKDLKFFIISMDNIYVPFFIENIRFKNSLEGFVSFKRINTEEKALNLSFQELFLPISFIKNIEEEQQTDIHFFKGFTVIDQANNTLGIIKHVHDETMNVLFELENELLIPAVEEYIKQIDYENKILHLNFPEGFFDF